MQRPLDETAALRIVVEAMPVGVSWARLSDQKILFINRKFTEIFGYESGEFANIAEWIDRTYLFEEDRELVARTWGAHLAAKEHTQASIEPVEIRVLCKDGEVKTILNSGVILPETGWALATFIDISERKRNELRIKEAERQAAENEFIYKLLLDHSPEMIVLSPFNRSRRYVSPAVHRITGFTAEEYISFKGVEMIYPEDREVTRGVIKDLKSGSLWLAHRYRTLRKDGGYCWVEANITGYLDPVSGRTAGYVAVIRDISVEREREKRLAAEHLSLTEAAVLDELTGIPNRRAFNQAFAGVVKRQTTGTTDLSLLMIDVDYFKLYNDFYGHVAGDGCLRKIAETLSKVVSRGPDLAARFGGEEFVLLLPMTDNRGAEIVARKVLKAVRSLEIPHSESPHGVVTVSIGVATWQGDLIVNETLLIEQADRSLYQAKGRGRNQYVVG